MVSRSERNVLAFKAIHERALEERGFGLLLWTVPDACRRFSKLSPEHTPTLGVDGVLDSLRHRLASGVGQRARLEPRPTADTNSCRCHRMSLPEM